MTDGLTSLFSFIGDDKLTFQWLNRSICRINTQPTETAVTFVTEHKNITADSHYRNGADETSSKIGIIVWIDANDWEEWKNFKDSKKND